MKVQKHTKFTVIVIVMCLLTMIGSVYVCSYEVREKVKEEMQKTLHDVAQQNNIAVQNEMNARFQLLYSIAAELEASGDVEGTIDTHKYIARNYLFKRVGYVSADGSVYTTDGYAQDMSELVFFRQGMEGTATFTEGTEEKTDRSYVSRFAVPVYNADHTEVAGVMFATYAAEWLEELLDTQSFAGQGYSCIVKDNGDVIAHSLGSPIYGMKNFFTCLEQGKNEKLTSAEGMLAVMQEKQSGAGCFFLNGEQNFYYTPLGLGSEELNRYMITVVPAEVLTARMQPIMNNVEQMFIILLMLVVCGVSIFFMTHEIRRKQLFRLAYTDALTKGDNFPCFQEKIKRKKGSRGYLIAMDLSDFKIINNTCGVSIGDEVLRCAWRVIHKSIREGELAARIYADRFILFLAEGDKAAVNSRLEYMIADMEKISEKLNTPRVVPIFGILETFNTGQLETDYGKAVQAKHLVKGRRDRKYAYYDEIDYAQVLEKRSIEDGFEQGIAQKQFEIWYQPKYDAENGTLVGAEALLRWRREDGTLMPPYKFIPIYEKNGMISRLDEYVFRGVCAQQKIWEQKGRKLLPISVNISRVSLYYYDIVDKYKNITTKHNVKTEYLQLEITESATIDNAEISSLIDQFHTAGFELLLDDFGSGYSSLSSLNMMHFDTMKLDKSLIDYIGDENGEKLLHYIIKLGQNLGLRVTAEGVETKEQMEFLRELQCDDIQGYYLSKPLPADEFEKLLK